MTPPLILLQQSMVSKLTAVVMCSGKNQSGRHSLDSMLDCGETHGDARLSRPPSLDNWAAAYTQVTCATHSTRTNESNVQVIVDFQNVTSLSLFASKISKR